MSAAVATRTLSERALEVLRRPQVREAFALSMVQAGRPRTRVRRQPPSQPRPSPVRSFFRSLVSLFITSPAAERPAPETNAAQ